MHPFLHIQDIRNVHFTEIDKTFQKDVRQLILSISTQFRTKKDRHTIQ